MEEPIDDLLSEGRDEEVKARINALLLQPAQTPMPPETAAGVLAAIMATDNTNNTPVVGLHRSGNWRLYAACAAIVILTLGGYFWFSKVGSSYKQNLPGKLADKKMKDVLPGGSKAILTLADGTVIDLDKAAKGELAKEGGSTVSKKEDSLLEFQSAHSPVLSGAEGTTHHSPAFNTVSTPNGGQYQVVLPDGTRVWLNAASSIRFPTSFAGDRKITMTGEAYFEVASLRLRSGQKIPFIVQKSDMIVQVLGTHFNINAYDNERAIHVTLLQGSVRVGSRQWAVGSGEKAEGRGQKAEKEQSVILKPGEQVSLSHTSQLSHPIPVQTEEVIAWKNGLFNLAGADLKDFMHQVERWYDVTVQYEGTVPNMEFQGKLNRAVPLSDIIDYLKNLGVECQLTGKIVHVKSK
jgi:ferric-dicitrate binding protein FerR (iron transport regulator)